MTTFLELATRAIGTDFPAAALDDAKRWVRTGLGELYVSAGFARNDMALPVVTTPFDPTVEVAFDARISGVMNAATGLPLDEVEHERVVAYTSSPPGNADYGTPIVYGITGSMAVEGVALALSPIPATAVTLLVFGQRAPDAGEMDDGDTVPLPEQYEDGPVEWARSKLFDYYEDDSTMGDMWRSRFEDTGKRMRSNLQRRSTRNRRVPGTWSGMTSVEPRFRHPRGLF